MELVNKSRKQTILALLIVPLLSSFPVLGEPPPGTPEVTNTYCQTWNNGTGICDDYNFAHDLTQSNEWVRSNYKFEMHNTTTITMTLEWEMHEFNRSLIGLEDMELGGSFDENSSGAPVDYIRNYLGYTTNSGLQVRQLILNEFSSTVEGLVNETYGGSAQVESQIVNQVTIEGQNIACTDDMNEDSIDEVLGLANNAFNPPLCLQSVAQIQVGSDILGVTGSQLDVERGFRGLLTMGAEITSNFTLVSRAGHRSTFELIPPDYASFLSVGGGGSLVPHQQGNIQYNSGSWVTDGLGMQGNTNTLINASITSILRDGTTNAVSIDENVDHGISIHAEVDLRDSINSRVSAEMDIHYLPKSILDDWGFSLGDGNIELPWITSDGIRMAHEYGLLDLDEFSNMIPLEDVEAAVYSASEIEIGMKPVTWKEPDASRGLNFTHTPSVTCAESAPVTHCLSGGSAMDGTFPVTLVTASEPFPADPLEKLTELISRQDGLENVTSITQDDVSALLSVLVYQHQLDTSFISDSIPDWLPPTQLEVTILLPDWIASDDGDPHSITLTASSARGEETPLAITAPNPYHRRWSRPICDVSAACSDSSPDLICQSDWRSCIKIHTSLNLPEFEIHEWSQEIEFAVEGQISIELYRIEIPQVLIEDTGVDIKTMPADSIRHIIAYGDEHEGGINGLLGKTIEVPLGDEVHHLELSNDGLQAFANSLSDMINDEISTMQHSDDLLTVDLSNLRVSASVDRMERPYNGIIDDDKPLKFILQLDKTIIRAKYLDGSISVSTSSAHGVVPSLMGGMLDVFNIRNAAESDGVVTLPPEPVVEQISPMYMVKDIDSGTDSNMDGNLNNDRDMDIRPALVFELTMPKGLELEFTSSLGRDEQSTVDGDRQHILYRVPLCVGENANDCYLEQSDEISLQFTVGYGFLIQELLSYLIGLLAIIFLLFYWRSRRKKEKRAAKQEKLIQIRSVKSNTYEVERELLGVSPVSMGAESGTDIDWTAGLDLNDDNW